MSPRSISVRQATWNRRLTLLVSFVVAWSMTTAVVWASTYISEKVTTLASGPVVWRPIPDPTNPGRFLPSFYHGGTVLAIPEVNTGVRTVVWKKTGLSSGY